ncbi:hypothetical protein CERSUDRAFT_69975 [Gelatoporia subvermispora B]|uniref:Uncharacterized protein n=1 Tax=Ceriporiopsis subvermispora (strain B) TaxID=914234 RepID=M2PX43_CERS8|nr:hypothetical protein CERSUDRAFT_69975 [Gelatoporia subvermispora B]
MAPDAFKRLAQIVRGLNDSTFFTSSRPSALVVYAPQDVHAYVISCEWDKRTMVDGSYGLQYNIVTPENQVNKLVFVKNVETAGSSACQRAFAAGIEWYAGNLALFTKDEDAAKYVM